MKPGLLWFDDDAQADFSLKVNRAVVYVHKKYEKNPMLCYVHPSMLEKNRKLKIGVEIRTSRAIRPNHFWLELGT